LVPETFPSQEPAFGWLFPAGITKGSLPNMASRRAKQGEGWAILRRECGEIYHKRVEPHLVRPQKRFYCSSLAGFVTAEIWHYDRRCEVIALKKINSKATGNAEGNFSDDVCHSLIPITDFLLLFRCMPLKYE
jgi:hypothetical protein